MARSTTIDPGDLEWRDAKGVQRKLKDMTRRHLMNTAEFLDRRFVGALDEAYRVTAGVSGEHAQDAADSYIRGVEFEIEPLRAMANAMRTVAETKPLP